MRINTSLSIWVRLFWWLLVQSPRSCTLRSHTKVTNRSSSQPVREWSTILLIQGGQLRSGAKSVISWVLITAWATITTIRRSQWRQSSTCSKTLSKTASPSSHPTTWKVKSIGIQRLMFLLQTFRKSLFTCMLQRMTTSVRWSKPCGLPNRSVQQSKRSEYSTSKTIHSSPTPWTSPSWIV